MKVLTDNQYYGQIADIIREQNGTSNTYTPPQMVSALKDLFYEEVEGAPPITFQGIGENLLDYRIDGASGGVGERTKNLFNFNKWSENLTTNANNELIISNNSITITAVENDAFTTPYYANHPNVYKIDVLPNSQYVLSWDSNNTLLGVIYVFKNGLTGSGNQISVNNATRKYITFSTDGNTTFITIRFGVMNAGDSITYSHIQLEEGSTVTDYEPYGYKVPVVISGKNLLPPITDWVKGYINSSGTITNASESKQISSPFIQINSNENFTFSFYPNSGNPWGCIAFYTDNKDYIDRVVDYENTTIFATTPNNAKYIRVSYRTYGVGTYAQLEEGSTATDYETYRATTTNIYIDEPIEGKANIPSEYTEVEYIKSTGTQYIDTGIKPNTGTTLFKGEFLVSNKYNVQGLFGCRDRGTAGSDSACVLYMTTGDLRLDWAKGDSTLKYAMATGTKFKIEISKNYAKIDDNDVTVQNTSEDVSLTRNFLIGNFYSGSALFTSGLIGNIYSCKLFNNNVLVRDFIPCYRKSDNVAGLYDLVNNTFYTNQGTGNFIVGSIKENESISLSDTNTNIPTIRGTNVLTVDTTVQPSNVYVKSRHESSYETAMRERYEEAQAQLDALESGGE